MEHLFDVREIEYDETKNFILNKHYAGRMPSISYSFGLFDNVTGEMVGLLTIGKPASPSLCKGVCGDEWRSRVYELNRLITLDGLPDNTLSWFVGYCLRLLKEDDLILVSYSDEGMNHHGYIYQATNWIYTGKTQQRTDKYTPKGKHSRHYDDKHNHLRKVRTSKHRYVYFTGKSRRLFRKLLKYEEQQYPKKPNKNYKLGTKMKQKIINKDTGEVFFE